MNFTQALAWLYETQHSGIKLGLEQIRRLLGDLGTDIRNQRFIHVAGTNGKGSVCAMLDAICRAEGIRTGLFTSPHLVHFSERIRLDGVAMSEDEIAASLTKIREIIRGWNTHPTFFEITTALALDWFEKADADVVILETGLGGRLDSTNVVMPKASVLTPIDLDHQAWLGSTPGEIAAEKAGIIKPGVPVVSAQQHQAVREVFLRVAAEKAAPIRFVTEPWESSPVNLTGTHQKFNASLAVQSLRAAKVEVSDESIRSGLKNVFWPGRFQIIRNAPFEIQNEIILDGAHNEAAAARVAATWLEVFGAARPAVILGVLKDKNARAICGAFIPFASAFITVPVRSKRSSPPEELSAMIRELAPGVECVTASGFHEAVQIARMRTNPILITGSLFLVGEALSYFEASGHKPEISLQ